MRRKRFDRALRAALLSLLILAALLVSAFGLPADDAAAAGTMPLIMADAAPGGMRVGIQVGHWHAEDLPDELAQLRDSTGTAEGDVAEVDLNLDIARRVAYLLEEQGITVDILPATIPPDYQADAFVALHVDGDASGERWGYKAARFVWSDIPETSDALLNDIMEEYSATTHFDVDPEVSDDMTEYYAFNSARYHHAVAYTTPAVIIEMGYLTDPYELGVLLWMPYVPAEGIARGMIRFLNSSSE